MGSSGRRDSRLPRAFDREAPAPEAAIFHLNRRQLLALGGFAALAGTADEALAASPDGQLTWAVHVSLAPTWFDPAETPGMITPFMLLYALHDAMVKPMPGQTAEPCLAETWKMAPDGLSYEFTVRSGVKFHNGEPVTAEDVKFSFERYRGTSAAVMKDRVAAVETPDARTVRFVLKKPWPDFLTFYASATGAGWIVPKKYLQQVGEEGFKKAPVGAGPYPARRPETRRGGHRLFHSRRAGGGAAAHAGLHAEAGRDPGNLLALLPGAMGSEVALA